jgi:hypothetical protein
MTKSYWLQSDDSWRNIDAKAYEEVQKAIHGDSSDHVEQPLPKENLHGHLPRLCSNYKQYKGHQTPRCSGGTGCQVCWLIYEERHK